MKLLYLTLFYLLQHIVMKLCKNVANYNVKFREHFNKFGVAKLLIA